MAGQTVRSLDEIAAEKKRIEQEYEEALKAQRDQLVPGAIETLVKFKDQLNGFERRRLANLLGLNSEPAAAKPGKKAGAAKTSAPAKYQIPSGDKWSGRGRIPIAFVQWADSAEGKKWREANPDLKFPPVGRATAKKATKKSAKKGSKKVGKKITKKSAKKG